MNIHEYTRFIDSLLFCEKHIDFFRRYRNITLSSITETI